MPRADQIEVTAQNGADRVLVADANILGLKCDIHLKLWPIGDHSSREDLSASRLSRKLGDGDLVFARLEDAIQVLHSDKSIGLRYGNVL